MKNSDLWTFALACYARPGVEAACLDLQARGADVCLLLCGAWLETRGVARTAQRLKHLQQTSRAWQVEVVEPLRRLRQNWKKSAQQDAGLDNLRHQVKALELEAERILLTRLQQAAQDWPSGNSPQLWLEALTGERASASLATLRQAATDA